MSSRKREHIASSQTEASPKKREHKDDKFAEASFTTFREPVAAPTASQLLEYTERGVPLPESGQMTAHVLITAAEKERVMQGQRDAYFHQHFPRQGLLVAGATSKGAQASENLDRLDYGTVADLERFNRAQLHQVMRQTFSDLQTQVGGEKRAGSSVLSVIYEPQQQRLIITQIGANEAALYIGSEAGGAELISLEPNIHTLNNGEELLTLKESGYATLMIKGREYLGHAIKLTRAMGGAEGEAHGLIHEPEIRIVKLDAEMLAAKRLVIIVGTSRFWNHQSLSDAKLMEACGRYNQHQPFHLTRDLLRNMRNGERDGNSSVLTMDLSEARAHHTTGKVDAISLLVCDGYRGAAVAECIRQNFSTTLQAVVDANKPARTDAASTAATAESSSATIPMTAAGSASFFPSQPDQAAAVPDGTSPSGTAASLSFPAAQSLGWHSPSPSQ